MQSRAPARIARKMLIPDEPAVRKVVRKAATLAELMTDQDREDDLRVLREAKTACTRSYDLEKKAFTEYPDHKTRLAAMALSRAYDEGTPVQRQVVVAKTFTSADEIIAQVKQSPELMRVIKAMNGAGIDVTAAGQIIEIDTDVQERGSESEGDSTEKNEP